MAGTMLTEERHKLRKVFRRWDMIFFSVAALVGLDAVAPMASGALGEGLVWTFVFVIIWLIPYGWLTAELGTAFPAEGGIYAWVRVAYGKLPGEITAIFYWFSNAIWIGGTLAASTIKAIDVFITPNKPLGLWPSVIIGLAFVWFNIWLSIIAFRHGKWAGNIGAWVKALAVAIFGITVLAFLIRKGVPHGVASGSTYTPSLTGFLAVAPIVVFLYVGFELQSSASEEMPNPQRDVPVGILRSGIMSSILYALVVICMLLALPVKQLTAVGGFLGASSAANTGLFGSGGGAKAMGYIIAIVWIFALVGSGSVWTLGSCRVQALAALDGSAPRWLGKISKQGTPWVMALITGVVGSAFVAIVLGYYKGSVSSFFEVMLSLTLSTTLICFLWTWPAVITLRRKYPNVKRPYRVTGGTVGLWVSVVLCEFCTVLTVITLLWPGLVNNIFGRSYSMQANWGVGRFSFEVITFGSVVVIALISVGLWFWGRAETKSAEVTVDELLTGVVEME